VSFRDVQRRLAVLEQARPEDAPVIMIQPIDMDTGQPLGPAVAVPVRVRRPSEPIDYREVGRALCPAGYEHARWEQQADGSYVWLEH
jgi:hypothetical protein